MVEDLMITDVKSEFDECNMGLEGVPMYRHMDLETFSPQLTGVDHWSFMPTDDFPFYGQTIPDKENVFFDDFGSPSKMMGDHSLIPDNPMDHANFITMKTQGLEEVALDSSHVNQLLFHDVGVPNDLIIEQGVEVGSENPHGDIMIVRNLTIKQEDIIAGEEVIACSEVDNEVVIDDNMESHLDTDHFVIGSSIDIGSDQIEDAGFEDTKLVIDTEQYCIDDEPSIGYDCQECGVLFKTKPALKKHFKNCHTKVSKSKSKKNSTKEKFSVSNQRYYCTSCVYTSSRRDKLDRHMEKHVLLDGVHPCGKKRHKPDALPQRHRHNAEEYKCPHCPYSCTVSKALKKHMKIHASGNSNFTIKLSCKICGKDRPSESEMQRHMKKHKKDGNFLCDICNFSSVQLKKIIQHRRMHTGDKPHLCPHCFYRSARRDNLRSHVRRMHKRPNMYIDTFNPKEEAAAL